MTTGLRQHHFNTCSLIYSINAAIFIIISTFYSQSQAEGLSLIINGKPFHKEQPDKERFNENNWGFGLQYDYPLYKSQWLPFITASGFRDSYKKNSYYAGGGLLRRFNLSFLNKGFHFDAGLVGFVMTREDHHNRKPFLGALPAFSFGTDRVAINASYVPKIEPKMIPLWFIQLKVAPGTPDRDAN